MQGAPRRRVSRQIRVGNVPVGGDAPVVVQSMTNTDTRHVAATVAQIQRLVQAGCEIVRVAVPNAEAVEALGRIKKAVTVPIIADIHFDHRLALGALRAGADGLRINPGNIGDLAKVRRVAQEARDRGVPLRIGVNSGSVERDLLAKHGGPTAEAMVESALRHMDFVAACGMADFKVSLKSSDVLTTVEAYRRLAACSDVPLHVGVTEAGPAVLGAVKSALGIGLLLADGIGDTIRVSVTADPEEELPIAYAILRSLGLRHRGVDVISCPTCGRTEWKLMDVVQEVERRLRHVATPLKVAVMGCAVNGPGEAREADVGIAGGRGHGILFKKGQLVEKVPEEKVLERLLQEVEAMTGKTLQGP